MLPRHEVVWGDVVFNELMIDPTPEVGLPPEEYIELYNRSAETIDMTGWTIGVGERRYQLSPEQVRPGASLEPGTYAVVRGIGLPNDGTVVYIQNREGVLVHAAEYALPWRGPSWKEEGGWALESPDPDRTCNLSRLWAYSNDIRGGTPGAVNSLDSDLEDREPPRLRYTGFDLLEGRFSLYFSEPVRCAAWATDHFPLMPDGDLPDSVAPSFPLGDRVDLWIPDEVSRRIEYTIQVPLLVDCSGNLSRVRSAGGGMALDPEAGDLVINEIMFHPQAGSPEFVELYNPGHRYQDLRKFCLDVVREGETPDKPRPLTDHSRLLAPGGYVVLAPHEQWLQEAYLLDGSGPWMGLRPWPALTDAGGVIYLTDRAGQTVDRAVFGEQYHLDLLDSPAGISLERIDADRPGDESRNWHSAASIAGHCTPGAPNSQRPGESEGSESLQIMPRVFSPDNDGHEDLLEITVRLDGTGWVVALWITDMGGRQVTTLANNHLAGPETVYRWDGVRDEGGMAMEGIYVLHARAYQETTGKIWRRRVALGLIYR